MGKRILLVEDNPDDEALTLRAFRKSNINNDIFVARDGAEAMDYLFREGIHGQRDPADLPALILMDLKLPKVDGLEVLRRIRSDARTESIPVVVLTSSNEDRDRIESYNLRANSYVRKPVDFNEFLDAVRQLGVYWITLDATPATRLTNEQV